MSVFYYIVPILVVLFKKDFINHTLSLDSDCPLVCLYIIFVFLILNRNKNNKTTNNPAAAPGALAQRSCIIAVPLRLGVDVIPAALHEHVKICLKSR